ncbi:FUSC family protein [Saccharomonospora sp. NPDC006951]
MNSTRADFAAPRWLVHLLRTTPAAVPWSRAARAAVALAVPLAVAYLAGDIKVGALISAGALPTVLAESGGTYRYRAQRLGGAASAAIIGYALGLLTGGNLALSIPTVVLIAAISALISAAGSNASVAGLQLFVFTVLGTGQHVVGEAGVALGWFVLGAAWGLIVALSGWTVHATSPERSAVAQVFIELAAMLSAQDEATQLAARQQLTDAMNTAYDRLLTARSWLSGRDTTYRSLLNLLSATTPAVEASVAMVNSGTKAPPEVIEQFTALATAVLAGVPLPKPLTGKPADPQVAALYHGIARIGTKQERGRRERVTPAQRIKDWFGLLVSGPLTWIATLRLTLCVALAELVAALVPVDRSYWITLTVGIVLKPDFGSVFGRAVLRGLGTVVGVGLGAAVLGLGAHGFAVVLVVAFFAAGAAIGKVRNYGILSAFVTPLIIVQMDLTAGGDWPVVMARLIDTVLGCVIVLVFGYLLWPGSRRPKVGGRLADVSDEVAEYVEYGLRPAETAQDTAERSKRRRIAYRGLADLRTAFQQLVVEPSPAGRQAAAWWPAIVALEQVADAVTAVVVTIEHGAQPPESADVELLTAALSELASAVREQRDPADVELPETETLSNVSDQLESAFDAVRGPDFSRSRFSFRRRG